MKTLSTPASFLVIIVLVACRAEPEPSAPPKEAELTNKVNWQVTVRDAAETDCRNTLTLQRNDGVTRSVALPEPYCLEDINPGDHSADGRFSIIHAVSRGIVDDGTNQEYVETYRCLFLDIEKAMLSIAFSGEHCGGQWRPDGRWEVAPDEIWNTTELFNL